MLSINPPGAKGITLTPYSCNKASEAAQQIIAPDRLRLRSFGAPPSAVG